ncbi:MAG: IS1182 family transposase [Prochloraceae cyanobacterium]
MRPQNWNPPLELSEAEAKIISKIRKAKLFIWLRKNRHLLFDEQFQKELAKVYKDSTVGLSPVPPAQLALTIILQAYTGVSDDEAIEAMVMDRRWQLVLNCLECEAAPFGKGTLVRFRAALMAKEGDRLLINKTVELAKTIGGYSSRSLRGALDSSPLWGAARVEDTYNLLGHALRKALSLIARQQGTDLEQIASQAGGEIVATSSLKAALDLDWDEKDRRTKALVTILATLNQVESWLAQQTITDETVSEQVLESIETAKQIEKQDVEVTPSGDPKLKKGVAKDRRISIEDEQMRHGRKSRTVRFDGYKRHLLKDLDSGLVRAVGITPANAPEASVSESIAEDLALQQVTLTELHIDRAYLSCHWVKQRSDDLTIFCKAWRVRNGDRFDKTAFVLDWDNYLIRCPNGVSIPFEEGKTARFPQSDCLSCPLKEQCTTSSRGRSVSIHPSESLLQELRQRQLTSVGRAQLRQRVSVEHSLAHISRWQGNQARYLGTRKNLFDLRRTAVVHNLHVIAQMKVQSEYNSA